MDSRHFQEDEDLALFQDIQARQHKKFLLPSHDFQGSSLKYEDELLSLNMSNSTPSRKGSELLISDSGKSDYDWLLTPPGTPLFPSLDQEVPVINLSQRRVLARSVSASRTSRLSYSPASSSRDGNPTSWRPSNAPLTNTAAILAPNRGRPSSPSVRPTLTVRSSSPCRSTTPNGRSQSRGASRSPTPPLQSRTISPSMSRRALCASRESRGKSPTPKSSLPWETSMLGFSDEPPPNLRTSVIDCSILSGLPQGTFRSGLTKSGVECGSTNSSHSGSGSGIHSKNQDRNLSSSRGLAFATSDVNMATVKSISSDNTGKHSNQVIGTTKATERPNVSRGGSVISAKRYSRPIDAAPFTKSSTRKSFDRQSHHQSSNCRFRPLMSSAPAISFYDTPTALADEPLNLLPLTSLALSGDVEHTRKGVQRSEKDMQDETAHDNTSFLQASGNQGRCDGHQNSLVDSGKAKNLVQISEDPRLLSLEKSLLSDFSYEAWMGSEAEVNAADLVDASKSSGVVLVDTVMYDQMHNGEPPRHHCNDVTENVGSKGYFECCKTSITAQKHSNGRENALHENEEGDCVALQTGRHRHTVDGGSFQRQYYTKSPSSGTHDGTFSVEKSGGEYSAVSHGDCGSSTLNRGESWNERSILLNAGTREATVILAAASSSEKGSADQEMKSEVDLVNNSFTGTSRHSVNPNDAFTIVEGYSCDVEVSKGGGVSLESPIGKEENLEQKDALSILALCMHEVVLEKDVLQHISRAADPRGLQLDPTADRCVQIAASLDDGAEYERKENVAEYDRQENVIHDSSIPSLRRNVTLEEATDTILFCSSIIHEIVYKAASSVIEAEKENTEVSSRKEFVTTFDMSGNYPYRKQGKKKEHKQIRDISRQTLSQVQIKQRMVHQQPMAVTLCHNPTDRIENAVIGNNEAMHPPTREMVTRRMPKRQGKKITCKCRCCIM